MLSKRQLWICSLCAFCLPLCCDRCSSVRILLKYSCHFLQMLQLQLLFLACTISCKAVPADNKMLHNEDTISVQQKSSSGSGSVSIKKKPVLFSWFLTWGSPFFSLLSFGGLSCSHTEKSRVKVLYFT